MRIDLSLIDREQFVFRDCVIGGDECWLIFPSALEASWTPETLPFRSVIVRKIDGKVISIGQLKFFNHGQSPELYPDPLTFNDWVISTKEDGSLVICSHHKGQDIVRTRGTVSVDIHETGVEINRLVAATGVLNRPLLKDGLVSYLFEHCSPSNQIVISYEKPKLVLLDIVWHEDCSYLPIDVVNAEAQAMSVERPNLHTFGSLTEIAKTLKTLTDIEGYVLAYAGNQHRVKLKTESYLIRHRFKSRATLPNVLELWMAAGRPLAATFRADLAKTYDNECLQMVSDYVTSISLAWGSLSNQLADLALDIEPLKNWARRDAALKIQADYTEKGLTGPAFNLLSNRPVEEKTVYRLMEKRLGL